MTLETSLNNTFLMYNISHRRLLNMGMSEEDRIRQKNMKYNNKTTILLELDNNVLPAHIHELLINALNVVEKRPNNWTLSFKKDN